MEVSIVEGVFESAFDWRKVHIREESGLARFGAKYAKKKHLGFVLFRTINFSRKLNCEESISDRSWLVHEMTHVLQFNELGAQYIIEALRAQNTAGYYYGGLEGLKQVEKLASFNLEQQADIARDYYKTQEKGGDTELYDPFIKQIRKAEF
ncbi:MAG: hypothetical protein H6600_06335 [Flavobacteriales bacterium]|nr:hypothetical protein [Flavobacteriales bacterium]